MNIEALISELRKDLAGCQEKASHLRMAISSLMALDGHAPAEATPKTGVSRQRQHQIARNQRGLCSYCVQPLAPGSKILCERHREIGREKSRRRANCSPWKPGSSGRIPNDAPVANA